MAPVEEPGMGVARRFEASAGAKFAVKDYYFEMTSKITQVSQLGTDDDGSVVTVRVDYEDIQDEDRKHLEQFVRDQEAWKGELPSA